MDLIARVEIAKRQSVILSLRRWTEDEKL